MFDGALSNEEIDALLAGVDSELQPEKHNVMFRPVPYLIIQGPETQNTFVMKKFLAVRNAIEDKTKPQHVRM